MFPIKVTIEFATAADVVEIGELSKSLVEYGLGWRYTPKRLRKLIETRTKNVVVARKGEKLAGFGIMTYWEDNANLDLLAVKPRYRRRSIGKQIVEWLVEVARTAGIMNVFVQVRKLNSGAIRFYENIGFQTIDEEPGYYRGQETGVILCKPIRPIFVGT
jgi:ribosomal-protein-alanine N-acetyltransferase